MYKKRNMKNVIKQGMLWILICAILSVQIPDRKMNAATEENRQHFTKMEGNETYDIFRTTYNGSAYQFVKNTKPEQGFTWYEAEELCEKWDGHLVAITSAEEQQFLEQFIQKEIGGEAKNDYWIGAYEDEEQYKWKWVTGEEFDYSNWAYGEPNDHASHLESYGQMIGKLYTAGNRKEVGQWNDASNVGAGYANEFFACQNYGFIMEQDGLDSKSTYVHDKATIPVIYNMNDEPILSDFYYRDDYFMNDPTIFNASLATMSLYVAMAAMGMVRRRVRMIIYWICIGS